VQFGSRPIRNIYDYTEAIRETKPGDSVEIIVKRGSERLTIRVDFPSKVQ
jgi:S1-C subfamily serine protease